MCSFLFCNKPIEDIENVNKYLRLRGADNTNIVKKDNFTFIHNLLHITGEKIIQPFVNDNIWCMYNGEIYNYKQLGNYKSDGEAIIPLYQKYGINFVKYLDGEYAICLIDFKLNRIIIATDQFSTKPLFIGMNQDKDEIGICTYRNPLKKIGFSYIEKVRPNTLMYSLNDYCTFNYMQIVNWNLNQHKDNFNDWIRAFENSIRKRTQDIEDRLFMGLSSGYDTGAILCEILKQKVNIKTYTIVGTAENIGHLQKRWKLINNKKSLEWNDDIQEDMQDYITKNIEQYLYKIHSTQRAYNEFDIKLMDDSGAYKLAWLCRHAKEDGKKIGLSGMGADELFSDYGIFKKSYYDHSNFNGIFPDDLNTIFPWASFNGSSMESYLMKDEYIGGSYNLEMRYPFLDREVVQEFLFLKAELKNIFYKSPLHAYMKANNFPFSTNEKIGF